MTATPEAESGAAQPASEGDDHLAVDGLSVWFPIHGGILRRQTGWVQAVEDVSFTIPRGTTLGLVGESGSGKTTIGRAIVRINRPLKGSVRLDGDDLLALDGETLRRRRRQFQMVFQDPQSSLDPRMTVGQILDEPLRTHRLPESGSRQDRIEDLLTMVGLDPAFVSRYPHEFSGGQRQRIGIARALAVEPEMIVCDEPISALDVSIQAQVLNLLEELQERLGLTYLIIAHDLAVVRHIAHRVAVMYLGKLVEIADSDALYEAPQHPYTAALLSAVPVPNARRERSRKRIILTGDIPSPADPPSGCRFHTRCWLRDKLGDPERCATEEPVLASDPGAPADHVAACHFTHELRTTLAEDAEIQPVSATAAAAATAGAGNGRIVMMHIWVFESVAISVGYWEQQGEEVDYGARMEVAGVVPDEVPGVAAGVAGIRLLPISEGIWRADLFVNRLGPIYHYHPEFADGDVGERHLDDALTADPVAWAIDQLTDIAQLLRGAGAEDVVADVPQALLDPLLPTIRAALESSFTPDREA